MSPTFQSGPRYAVDLLRRLATIADKMVADRVTQISDAALRQLKDEVEQMRGGLAEGSELIGYEATCMVECIAALAYARTDRNVHGEERAKMYLNCFRVFVRGNAESAQRRLEAQ